MVTPKKFIRKITKKSRYSYFISIPKELMEKYGWRERQKLVLKPCGKDKIVIEDWEK